MLKEKSELIEALGIDIFGIHSLYSENTVHHIHVHRE